MANSYSGVSTSGLITSLPQALMDVYSLDILHNAQGIMRYEEFAVKKTELSAAPGQRVLFTAYSDITRGTVLTESASLETKSMAASQIPCVVTEYGNAIGMSEKLLQLSWDNLLSEASTLLGRDYAVVRDLSIRDVVAAGGTNTLFTTAGATNVGGVLPGDYFDVETLRVGLEALQTANAPKFYGDFYVCFVHPHQAAYLRRDPDWIAAHHYAGSRNLFNGEVGRWEDCIFVVTTHQGNGAAGSGAPGYEALLDGAGDDGQNLYRATLIADQAYGVADALPVELRDNGVQDFGRTHALAWYGIWGQTVLNDEHLVQIISS